MSLLYYDCKHIDFFFFSPNCQTVKRLDHLHSTPLGHSGILSAYFCPPSCRSAKRPM